MIEGVGPRYCPSIEDKVVRFANKERHQLFIEPMGLNTEEVYIQGMSSSMPEDVQIEMIHSVIGLEHAEVMRSAYAIEYDCVNPLELHTRLWRQRKFRGYTAPGNFAAPRGMRRRPLRGSLPVSMPHLR